MAEDKLPGVSRADVDHIIKFIRETVRKAGAKGVVVGLSGGLDSAVVTKLSIDALGAENVLNVFMPSRTTPHTDYKLTMDVCDDWETEYRIVDIQPAVDALASVLQSDEDEHMERGNISSRIRMTVLYNLARKYGYIVAGTSNQSELMTGYFTKFGDGASDMMPLSNAYKSQVKQIAGMIDIPSEIIDRPPSAGFWEDQTDEEEMGITYGELDLILYNLELGAKDADIAKAVGCETETVRSIREQVKSTEHKRTLPTRPGTLYE